MYAPAPRLSLSVSILLSLTHTQVLSLPVMHKGAARTGKDQQGTIVKIEVRFRGRFLMSEVPLKAIASGHRLVLRTSSRMLGLNTEHHLS